MRVQYSPLRSLINIASGRRQRPSRPYLSTPRYSMAPLACSTCRPFSRFTAALRHSTPNLFLKASRSRRLSLILPGFTTSAYLNRSRYCRSRMRRLATSPPEIWYRMQMEMSCSASKWSIISSTLELLAWDLTNKKQCSRGLVTFSNTSTFLTDLAAEPGAEGDENTLLVANRSMLLSNGLMSSLVEATDCRSFAAVTVDKSSKSANVNSAN
mmetsp:Transcript_19819/g.27261  ORF Transcript_19819/g.27261 Transcript_19819/m.27261 type:complete len:212 (-) Transcript_19819:1676-2311(-)